MLGVLEAIKEIDGRKLWPLSQGSLTFGRASSSNVLLTHPSISREHAIIKKKQGRYIVQDKQSRNGTRINGVFCIRHFLHDGDHIAFGDVEFIFHETDELCLSDIPHTQFTAAKKHPVATATVTTPIALSESVGPFNNQAFHAWQSIQQLSVISTQGLKALLQHSVDNIFGLRDVEGVMLYMVDEDTQHHADRFNAGKVYEPHERLFEKHIEQVIKQRKALGFDSGFLVQDIMAQAVETVFIPINGEKGESIGCLVAKGTNRLSSECVISIISSTAALGVTLTIWNAARYNENKYAGKYAPDTQIVGHSKALRAVIVRACRAAQADSTVLLRGETGTGKELFARLIYEESRRCAKPFLTVHCSAIEETLLGSVLFGHEKGAFTGAVSMKRGLFEEADGGTLFLDEIGELSLTMQVKLLRVLQEGEFLRLGGNKPIHVNVRIIAATNRDLSQAIENGLFRSDLYFRLNVIEISIPPLREHSEDIPDMTQHFLQELSVKTCTNVTRISDEVLDVLSAYSWPGNIRELRNVIERCLVFAAGQQIKCEDIPLEILHAVGHAQDKNHTKGQNFRLQEVEREHILQVLGDCGGNKKMAATCLGISRSTLYEKLKTLEREN
ncbi:MAG: FHA domain-containing protein [Verrucomicrobiae bacterium]|nr:FHA domain-containing protein [Verrucomicrobiae bacterium]